MTNDQSEVDRNVTDSTADCPSSSSFTLLTGMSEPL